MKCDGMTCAEIRKLFSPYLDGRVSGSEMRALTRHVEQCDGCAREYAATQRTQQLLASLGPKKAPADLALKLRVAISREAAQKRRPRYEGVLVRLRMRSTLLWFRPRRGWSAPYCFSDCCWASLPCRHNCGPAAETFR